MVSCQFRVGWMKFYSVIRKLLFLLDPEVAHAVTLSALQFAYRCRFISFSKPTKSLHQVMGLSFPSRIGLAAGLDKNGDYIDALAALGFGFIEVGTVTPKAQSGNPKPRLFRLPKQQAIVNRMGFNNKGVDHLVKCLQRKKFQGIVGVNIGKNRDTPIEKAHEDYITCFRRVAPYASYVTINISSPNTAGLRELQQIELLQNLLSLLKKEQAQQERYVPLVVKIAPDLSAEEIKNIATVLLDQKMDGVVATNTMLSKEGGLSGKPLAKRSTEVIKTLQSILQNRIPIIGCGGVFSKEDVQEKISAGASLIQVYTGLIYEGLAILSS